VCVAYVDFIKGALVAIISDASEATVMALMFPVVSLLALLRSFKYLAFTSILGDVAVAAGLIGTIAIGVSNGHTPQAPAVKFDVQELPRSAGSIAFLFLIHVVILPISQSMRDLPAAAAQGTALTESLVSADLETAGAEGSCGAARPRGFGSVAVVSYTLISVVNAGFGGLCVMMWGDDLEPNVLSNLPKNSGSDAIQLLLCVDLLFTIPMILAAGREILEGAAMSASFGVAHPTLTQTLVRVGIVGIIFAIAAAIPKFGDVVSLIGGLANSLMGLILPPLFLVLRGHRAALLVSLLGLVLLVSSTYFTLHDMTAHAATANHTDLGSGAFAA